jgi:hypothetical protein
VPLQATNPTIINEGVQGLTAGLTAVIATLRMEFAQTVTLGVSLGDIFTSVADKGKTILAICAILGCLKLGCC